jgi:hypothetical protein
MRRVEITRAGDASIADQLKEMRARLRARQIEPLQLEPMRILNGLATFQARFATTAEAERFRQRFDEIARTPEPAA